MIRPDFWKNKRILLTGHTGFKGAWASQWLSSMGAKVTGFSLAPQTSPSLWQDVEKSENITSLIGDVRNIQDVQTAIEKADAEIIIHMAAKALVRESYRLPHDYISTNVDGTSNLLNTLRDQKNVKIILVVTSDKVYKPPHKAEGYNENDSLGGSDPYSASKAAQDLVAQAYAKSYFDVKKIPLLIARAGNVIGGGDWSEDRLIPDFERAIRAGQALKLRYPKATRPWQHVLNCLYGYFIYIEKAYQSSQPTILNFGPQDDSILTVEEVVRKLSSIMGGNSWEIAEGTQPAEALTLKLNSNLAQQKLNLKNILSTEETIEWTANWYNAYRCGHSASELCQKQISAFMKRLS